jgi:hypothetical protein
MATTPRSVALLLAALVATAPLAAEAGLLEVSQRVSGLE